MISFLDKVTGGFEKSLREVFYLNFQRIFDSAHHKLLDQKAKAKSPKFRSFGTKVDGFLSDIGLL